MSGTGYSEWDTVLAGAMVPIWTVSGSFRIFTASVLISLGMVAEKKSVCRLEGTWSRMRRTSGKKPMSHIVSASSRTRISTPVRLMSFWLT